MEEQKPVVAPVTSVNCFQEVIRLALTPEGLASLHFILKGIYQVLQTKK